MASCARELRTPAPEHPGEGTARRRLAALGAPLLTVTALPAAVLVVPDAAYGAVPAAAHALGLDGAGVAALLTATGLSLPALALAVPPAAVAARALPAWTVLAAGLGVLLAGLCAARFAGSVALAGTVRAVQGAGAGIVLPAVLVLVWERRSRTRTAVWAGVFTGALILAMPAALSAVPAGGSWQAALAPVPWLAVAAAVAAGVHPAPRGRRFRARPAPRRPARGGLLLTAVPAAGFTFLTVVAAHGWSPGARLLVAGLALPALLGLALAGTRGAADGAAGCAVVMIAAGLLVHPVAGPLAGLAGASWPPFAAGAAAACAGALAATRVAGRIAVPAGYALVAGAMLPCVAADPREPWALPAVLVPLGAGAGLAVAAALRDAGVDAALFGLSLFPPALLTGQLTVLSLQAAELRRLRPATGARYADALLDGYRGWLVIAAGAAVLLAAVAVRVRPAGAGTTRPGPAPAGPARTNGARGKTGGATTAELHGNAASGARAG